MSDSTDYLSNAIAAADVLTTNWFPPSAPTNWVPLDYWRTPVICTLLIDLMAQTNKVDYTETVENARKKGEPWMGSCAFYDDLTWWGRLFIHAYHYFKRQSNPTLAQPYLDDAKFVCDQLSKAWDDYASPQYCNGGVWWMRPKPWDPYTGKFKAANSTLGFMETALALYLELGDQQYLDFGKKAWQWIVDWKFVDSQGMVWGALTHDCTIDPENVPVLSLQGEALTPLWMFYQATKDTHYLDVADQVAEGTMQLMVWAGTQIMEDRVDAEWSSQPDNWKVANDGDTPFKGLFATYLAEYANELSKLEDPTRKQQAAKYAAFLRTNADAVWTNYPGTIFSMDWHTLDQNYQPIPNADVTNASMQYSGICALAGAALFQ